MTAMTIAAAIEKFLSKRDRPTADLERDYLDRLLRAPAKRSRAQQTVPDREGQHDDQ